VTEKRLILRKRSANAGGDQERLGEKRLKKIPKGKLGNKKSHQQGKIARGTSE